MNKKNLVFVFVFFNLSCFSQGPSDITSFLEKAQLAVNNLNSISINLDVDLKYFTESDTLKYVINCELIKNENSIVNFDFNISDLKSKSAQWLCNNIIYTSNNLDSTIEVNTDFDNFNKSRLNNFIITWFSRNFIKNIIGDTNIIRYDLSYVKNDNIFLLKLSYKTPPEVKYYFTQFTFDASTYYLTQILNEAYWDDMIQSFKYSVNYFKPLYKMSFCDEINNYKSFQLSETNIIENNDSLFNSLDTLPNFELPDLNSNVFNSNQIEKPTLLYFWYIGCYPCRMASPLIDSLYNKYRDNSVKIIGINPQDNKEKIIKYLNKKNYKFPTLYLAQDYCKNIGLFSYPMVLLIDTNKKILMRYNGFSEDMFEPINQYLQKISK